MKRIISKVDYEMYKKGQLDPKLALEEWYKICKSKILINGAIEVVEDAHGQKCFFAPTICHMILSNPWDVPKEIYDKLVMMILKNDDLNKLTVFNDTTFLSLIMLNGALGFDDLYVEVASKGIRQKAKGCDFEIRQVQYTNLEFVDIAALIYENNDLVVKLTQGEADFFTYCNAFSVETIKSLKEIEALVEIANLFPMLDERIIEKISELQQYLENEQRLLNVRK